MGILENILSKESGQKRRTAIDEFAQGLLDHVQYFAGPGVDVDKAASLLDMFNPVSDIGRSMQASEEMLEPGRTPRQRLDSGASMATDMAAVLAPAISGRIAGSSAKGASDVIDSLLGIGAMPREAATDAGRRFAADQSGSTPSGPVQTEAQIVAEMLKRGDAADVTDDMMARVDPQEMFRLYESGATGMNMPMDAASRTARAEGMGFGDMQYHATNADFQEFKPSQTGLSGRGVYSGDEAVDVQDYAVGRGADGARTIPIVTPAAATYARKMQWEDALTDDFYNMDAMTPEAIVGGFSNTADAMSANGYSGVISNSGERVTFDPANIRSRFARFDPRLKELSNLSASIGGLLALFMPDKEGGT